MLIRRKRKAANNAEVQNYSVNGKQLKKADFDGKHVLDFYCDAERDGAALVLKNDQLFVP